MDNNTERLIASARKVAEGSSPSAPPPQVGSDRFDPSKPTQNRTSANDYLNDANDISKRNIALTTLIEDTAKGIQSRITEKRKMRRIAIYLLIGILLFILFGCFGCIAIAYMNPIDDIIAMTTSIITLCVTNLGSVVAIITIMLKYMFPDTEEQYAVDIIKMALQNDIEQLRLMSQHEQKEHNK